MSDYGSGSDDNEVDFDVKSLCEDLEEVVADDTKNESKKEIIEYNKLKKTCAKKNVQKTKKGVEKKRKLTQLELKELQKFCQGKFLYNCSNGVISELKATLNDS